MSNMKELTDLMYGPGGLGVTNVGITLGTNRDVTSEQVAGEMLACLKRLIAGDYTVVADVGE